MKKFFSNLKLILIILGVIFIYMSIKDYIHKNTPPVDISTLTPATLEKGMIVEGDISYNFGAFMEEYSTRYGVKTGSSTYTYLIPIGNAEFMGIQPHGEDMTTQFDRQADATIAYMLDETTSQQPDTIHITGQIKTLNSESLGYMQEYLGYMGYSKNEASTYSCNYYISCESYDYWWVWLLIGIGCLALGILLLLSSLSITRRQKAVSATPQVSPNPSYSNFTPYNGTTTVSDDLESKDDAYTSTASDASTDSQESSESKSASGFSLKLDD